MPNKGVSRPHWNDEEDAIVMELYPDVDACIEGLAEIGSDRNRDAVMRRAKKLSLREVASNKPWTDEEDAILRKCYPSGGTDAVCDELGKSGYERSYGAVMSRASALGVRRVDNSKGQWSDDEVRIVREFYPIGGVIAVERELRANGYERSRAAINSRVQIVGARKNPVRRSGHTGDIKVVNFVVDTVLDKDIIEFLGSHRNRSEYLRRLIAEDMRKSQ